MLIVACTTGRNFCMELFVMLLLLVSFLYFSSFSIGGVWSRVVSTDGVWWWVVAVSGRARNCGVILYCAVASRGLFLLLLLCHWWCLIRSYWYCFAASLLVLVAFDPGLLLLVAFCGLEKNFLGQEESASSAFKILFIQARTTQCVINIQILPVYRRICSYAGY